MFHRPIPCSLKMVRANLRNSCHFPSSSLIKPLPIDKDISRLKITEVSCVFAQPTCRLKIPLMPLRKKQSIPAGMGIVSSLHTSRSSLRRLVKSGGLKTWCEQNKTTSYDWMISWITAPIKNFSTSGSLHCCLCCDLLCSFG